jgi:transposase
MPSNAPPGPGALAAGAARSVMRLAGIEAALAGALDPDKAEVLCALVANIVVGKVPLYDLSRWARDSGPGGGRGAAARAMGDDRVGRALDALFGADAPAVCALAVAMAAKIFAVDASEVHNDSTTISLNGPRRGLDGKPRDGLATARAARGHAKNRRFDLKQLLVIASVAADGAVPLALRLADGNSNDCSTHIDSFDALTELLGTADIVYVADCKLATTENMAHIGDAGAVFVTVVPADRKEARWADQALAEQPEAFDFEEVISRPSRAHPGTTDTWHASPVPFESREGYRLVVVRSDQGARAQADARAARLAALPAAITDLNTRMAAPKTNIKTPAQARAAADKLLGPAKRWARIDIETRTIDKRVQAKPGRPGPKTEYRTVSRSHNHAVLSIDDAAVAASAATDGAFPLITNSTTMTPAEVLLAYKRQPDIEKRFAQLKTAQRADPIRLHKPERVHAMAACHHLAALTAALIELLIRRAMDRDRIPALHLYPEHRPTAQPTAALILRALDQTPAHPDATYLTHALTHPATTARQPKRQAA